MLEFKCDICGKKADYTYYLRSDHMVCFYCMARVREILDSGIRIKVNRDSNLRVKSVERIGG